MKASLADISASRVLQLAFIPNLRTHILSISGQRQHLKFQQYYCLPTSNKKHQQRKYIVPADYRLSGMLINNLLESPFYIDSFFCIPVGLPKQREVNSFKIPELRTGKTIHTGCGLAYLWLLTVSPFSVLYHTLLLAVRLILHQICNHKERVI